MIAIENTRLFEEVQARTRELSTALEQQTATSEVLKVISRSAFDLQKVLDTLIESAAMLCGADMGAIRRREGDSYRVAATYGYEPQWHDHIAQYPPVPDRSSIFGRTALEGRTVHVPDVLADPEFERPQTQRLLGFRAALGVPLLRDGSQMGVLVLQRFEPGEFTPKQIELVETFADQAVIAIENTRLLNELRESLQQQTATADVLKVISRSTFDLQTVLQTLVESAARLCDADRTNITRERDGAFYRAEGYGFSREFQDFVKNVPIKAERGSAFGRALLEGRAVHIPDVLADPEYTYLEGQRLGAYRTVLAVPMLREGIPIGVLSLTRSEVRPFTEQQINLATTFADQAAIAIENVRLFDEVQARTRELQEALEYQTATSDVLNVISRSPSDIQPVLDTIAGTAGRLCEAYDVLIRLQDGQLLKGAAHRGSIAVDFGPLPIGRGWAMGRAFVDRTPVHVHDLLAAADEFPDGQAMARRLGVRTILAIPLMREKEAIGAIAVRRAEVRPFSDKQIGLLQTFADQAVIAIENARLFEEVQARTRELQEALEYQTATSEVLNVISRSPTNAQPVFDAIVESASRLCEATFSVVWRYDGDLLHYAASHNFTPEVLEHILQTYPKRPDRSVAAGRAILDGRLAHIPDMLADQEYAQELALAGNWRSSIAVPMLQGGKPVGAISVGKAQAERFSERQIQLLSTFADQAVIAIENVRLFEEAQVRTRELTTALEQQTATSEVLKVISRSAFDLQPVLDTLVETVGQLCEADRATVFRYDGMSYRSAAHHGYSQEFREFLEQHPIAAGRGTAVGRTALEGRTVHIPDVLADPEYTFFEAQRLGGWRATLAVPLLREGKPIGAFSLNRSEPRPFTDKQIELVTTFADQAVIAIENVRLFEEVQARTAELRKRSSSRPQPREVLQRHQPFAVNLQPVLDTLVQSAARLCEADIGTITRQREGEYSTIAPRIYGLSRRIR